MTRYQAYHQFNMVKEAGHLNPAGGLEGRMAKRHLSDIIDMAEELYCCIDDHDDLHEWVQVKIATVRDRLQSVHSFMSYEAKNPREPYLGKYAEIKYRGHTFPGYNQPIRNTGSGKHKKMVLAKKGDKVLAIEDESPVDTVLGLDIFPVLHIKSQEKIYISLEDVNETKME